MPQSRDSIIELRVKEALEYLQVNPSAKPTTIARQFSISHARLLRHLDGIPPRTGIPATNTKLSKQRKVHSVTILTVLTVSIYLLGKYLFATLQILFFKLKPRVRSRLILQQLGKSG